MPKKIPSLPLPGYRRYPTEEMRRRSDEFYTELNRRRTVRHYSDQAVLRELIENCLHTAGTAPSGANRQPWHFVAVSDPEIKKQIRAAAEEEERAFYGGRAPDDWLAALAPLGTDADKSFLETAPYLIAIFAQSHSVKSSGDKEKNYYVQESVGIATGMLITAIHHAGLVSLTHTPSPMRFLNKVLGRPPSERPFLLLVVGFPAEDATVPDISRKSLSEISTFLP